MDFDNGFIEVYRDARGAKGSSQSFVTVTDEALASRMRKLADNAQYFEDHAPWLAQYKKQGVKPPVAKAVEALIETGDFHVTTIGDNLPNENEMHEKYGSKSFMFTGSSHAFDRATGVRPAGRIRRLAGGDRARQEIRRRSGRPDDGAARGHRAWLGQTESEADARAQLLPEGIFFHAGRRRAPT